VLKNYKLIIVHKNSISLNIFSMRIKAIFLLVLIMTLGLLCRADGGHAQQPLVLTTSMTSPLSRIDQTGFYDQVLAEAFRRVEQPMIIKHLTTERSITNANLGVTDGEFPRISGLEHLYPNLHRVPEKIDDFEFVAFTWRSDIQLKNWASCKPYNVAIVRGWKILETNLADVKSLLKVKNQRLLFPLLAKHRTDIVVYSHYEGLEIIEQLGLQSIRVLEPPLATREMFLYLNKKHISLIPALTKQLQIMKHDGTYDRIYRKMIKSYLEDSAK
jgi:polar amino acid transport system substrate-binding protein